MSMIFTKEMLDQVYANAIIRAAKSIASDGDLTGYLPEDIVKVISQSERHKEAVVDLIAAYQDWYHFHLTIYEAGKSGNLSAGENAKLLELIDRRDAAKSKLLAIT
ncbi:hypothetical protein [Agrobacterium larrymoorei]|uniref:Uncharacterized protein n=1 Tax=Agrobacterium larrymoorei TaxID=160699 RepID=A0ABU0UGZ7_9HYPH|nr:hypothetical protein [Agrobacterium larrymoorei]MDQ1184199.1 hypothetical protein [Agrobacterium larrymoorei]